MPVCLRVVFFKPDCVVEHKVKLDVETGILKSKADGMGWDKTEKIQKMF